MAARLTPEQKLLREQMAPKVGAVVAYVDGDDLYRIGRVIGVTAVPATGRVIISLTDRSGKTIGATWIVEWFNLDMTIIATLSEVTR